jgi:murein DD-endopeptidase MepM/ murein hydrolase activator NlpD
MPIPTPVTPLFTYHTVEAGESLGYLSSIYNTPIEELVAMNQLDGPEAIIQIGQSLRVPLKVETTAPTTRLLPDSEVVYGPGYVGFEIEEFIKNKGGYLADYTEYVDGQILTGPEIVKLVAEQFSVGPRLLLALLEHYGGWVTNPYPTAELINQPLGPANPRGGSLYLALSWTANRINAGYYGYKRNGFWVFTLADGSRAVTSPGLNAGTVGVQNILALHSKKDTWLPELGPEGLMAIYRALFGNPQQYAVEPLVPKTLTQPPLNLPWGQGKGFYLTSGPHPAYIDGSAWAALDFGPPDVLGSCFYSSEPNTAAAAGIVVVVRPGAVELDLDGDGHIQTGWVLQYLHVVLDAETPVQVGQRVAAGDVIGYASCEGGQAESSHLHLSRRYNGEWLEAGGPVPMNLGGWVAQPTQTAYEGRVQKGSQSREACECWEPAQNLIVNQ